MQNDNVKFEIILLGICFFAIFGLPKSSWAPDWYVDNTATGSNNGTSWGNAWTSFSAIQWGSSCPESKMCPGDTLYISGGSTSKTYTATSDGMLYHEDVSGSEGSLITITTGAKSPSPAGHDGMVIFDGDGKYSDLIRWYGSYIKVDGEKNGAINWKLQNTKMRGVYGAADFYGGQNKTITYLEVATANSGIAAAGAGGSSDDERYIEISHCYLHDIRAEFGIRLTGRNLHFHSTEYDLALIHHNVIELNNTMDGGGSGPDGIQGTQGMSIYNNTIGAKIGAFDVNPQHQDFIQAGATYVKIYNNAFLNASDSAIDFDYTGASSVGNINIYNNLFKRDSNQSATTLTTRIRIYRTSGVDATAINDIYILNNTFVDHGKYRVIGLGCNGKDPLTECNGTTATNVFIQNNLIYNSGNRVAPDLMAAVWIKASTGWTAADFNFDYNLINQGATGSSLVCIDDNVCNAETSYTQTHGQTGIPAFSLYTVWAPGNDFHLTSPDTAARDQGTNPSAYFTTDKDGVLRPKGTAWDIGAYEYAPGGDTTPPAAPTGVRVN